MADVAGALTSVFPGTEGFAWAREALEVWAGEKGVLGRKGVGEGSAGQGLGDC